MSNLLSLFPLDLVLLPGTPLPLHIFEPRYREMISVCVREQNPFGVVRSLGDEIAQVGCTAQILSVVKTYEDGSMDILTQGVRRFEVVVANQDLAYLRADVFFFEDDGPAASREEAAHLINLHRELMTLAGAAPEDNTGVAEAPLSFRLAGSLPLELDFKQTLLTLKSEEERVRMLSQYLESVLPQLRRTLYVRGKAGSNGHASQ